MGNNVIKPTTPVIADVFALFDEQFSVANLKKAISKDENQVDSVLSSVKKAVKKAASIAQEDLEESRFVVDLNDDLKQARETGEIILKESGNGDVPILFDDRIREVNADVYEGKKSEDGPLTEEESDLFLQTRSAFSDRGSL